MTCFVKTMKLKLPVEDSTSQFLFHALVLQGAVKMRFENGLEE